MKKFVILIVVLLSLQLTHAQTLRFLSVPDDATLNVGDDHTLVWTIPDSMDATYTIVMEQSNVQPETIIENESVDEGKISLALIHLPASSYNFTLTVEFNGETVEDVVNIQIGEQAGPAAPTQEFSLDFPASYIVAFLFIPIVLKRYR
ncbi:MAG: hypothetical protein INQ03_11120 [Candidatus Heimdallarchaeota archaeon]|nr:hypothetical protein [Candidatus Heimdallarchaeota archaeon]